MKLWQTAIDAIDPADGLLKTWVGPHVPGITKAVAEWYCQQNGLGYLRIVGELVKEIPCIKGSDRPDWGKAIDFENERNN